MLRCIAYLIWGSSRKRKLQGKGPYMNQESAKQPDQDQILIENETLRAGFTTIPNYVFALRLTPLEKLVLITLFYWAWDHKRCFPGRAELTRVTGISERQLCRIFSSLEKKKVLEIRRNGPHSNIYIIKDLQVRSDKVALQAKKKCQDGISKTKRNDKVALQAGSVNIHEHDHVEEKNTHTAASPPPPPKESVCVSPPTKPKHEFGDYLAYGKLQKNIRDAVAFAQTYHRKGDPNIDRLVEEWKTAEDKRAEVELEKAKAKEAAVHAQTMAVARDILANGGPTKDWEWQIIRAAGLEPSPC